MAKTDKPEKTEAKTKAEAKGEDKTNEAKNEAKIDIKAAAALDGKVDSKFDDVKSGAVKAPDLEAPKPGDGPKSATHNELPTEPERPRTKTDSMSAVTPVGEPPSVPAPKTVEDPTNMPGPKSIPGGNPTDAALPPGHVPPGDSRSLRRGNEFALVYRQGSSVITRWGVIGQRGQWRVVEYPTTSSASNSYAKECSRFVAEGFSDYRE